MTTEFYAECAGAMTENGIMLSNIIGSYTGKHGIGRRNCSSAAGL